jgi:methyl-accepting chemotaxis protein
MVEISSERNTLLEELRRGLGQMRQDTQKEEVKEEAPKEEMSEKVAEQKYTSERNTPTMENFPPERQRTSAHVQSNEDAKREMSKIISDLKQKMEEIDKITTELESKRKELELNTPKRTEKLLHEIKVPPLEMLK